MADAADTHEARTALERAAATPERDTILKLLERQGPEIAKVVGSEVGAARFARTVLTEVRRTPKLLECSPESLLGAMMLAAQLGLEPGPLGHVYLWPAKGEVVFTIGYRGYIALAFRSGQLKDIAAELVHAGDAFAYRFGTRPELTHEPSGPPLDRDIEAAYAVARLKTGGVRFVVLYEADWEKSRRRSPAGSKSVGPWVDDREAMIRKTAVRRLAPSLPQSPALAVGLERDDTPAPTPEEVADAADPS